jgi:biopolymer transport protein ExbB/TolQ
MEILLAVAVMVVAVASWFIAASLRSQIRQNAAELEQARKQIVAQCAEQAEERLRARDHDQAGPPGF